MPRYSAATNAALVRPVRCLPPLLQLAAVVRGGAAPLLSSTNHGPGWGTSGPEQAALRPAQPAQSPHTGNYRGPISSWCRLVPCVANGDVQLCGTIQSDVCSAPPPPGWVVANATLQQVCNPSQSLPGTQPAGFFSQLNVRNHKWHYIC